MPGRRGIAWLGGAAAVLVVAIALVARKLRRRPFPDRSHDGPRSRQQSALRTSPILFPRRVERGRTRSHQRGTPVPGGLSPYSYGRASARRIQAVAAPLARTLRRRPPRPPADAQALRPQVTRVLVLSANGDLGFDLQADVDDGRRRYAVIVAVRPSGRQWLVAALS